MKIKKFTAKDYQTALYQAKLEMGSEAIILQTRQIKKGGLLGLFSVPKVEITVAVDDGLKVNTDIKKSRPAEEKKITAPTVIDDNELVQEINSLKAMMSEIQNRMFEVELIKGIPGPLKEIFDLLVENNVEQGIAVSIVNQVGKRLNNDMLNDKQWIREILLHTIGEYLEDIKPIEISNTQKGMVVFFIGPTGVGKTTTIAKLAANLTFVEHRTVALITLDTYRISAPEQLRTFAEIIDIPISVVFDTAELQEAVCQYQDKDVIFVDTAGRSPYNDEHMEELKQYIDIISPDDIILVLSVTTGSNDMISIYEQFSKIRIDKIVFTKLDETVNYGQILNAIQVIRKPIAYLTNGQNVPDDIKVPDSHYLAQMLLGEDEAL